MIFWQEVVISMVTVIITISVTEYFNKKKALEDRKAQLRYKYLTESLELLNKLEVELLEYTRLLDSSLSKVNPEKRRESANEITEKASFINENVFVVCGSQMQIDNAIGIDLDLESLHRNIGQYVDTTYKLYKEYLCIPDTTEFTSEVTKLEKELQHNIGKCVEYIASEISKLL